MNMFNILVPMYLFVINALVHAGEISVRLGTTLIMFPLAIFIIVNIIRAFKDLGS